MVLGGLETFSIGCFINSVGVDLRKGGQSRQDITPLGHRCIGKRTNDFRVLGGRVEIKTTVGLIGAAYGTLVENLAGIIRENLESHSVAYVLGETDHVTDVFSSIRREGHCSVGSVINPVKEHKEHKDTGVGSLSGETLEWSPPIEGFDGGEVHDVGDIFKRKQPAVGGYTFVAHEPVGEALDILPSTFSKVLLLEIGGTLPGADDEMSEDVENALGYLNGGTITDEGVHCSPLTDVVKECVDELRGLLHTVGVDDQRFATNKDLGVLDTSGVNCGDVHFHIFGGDGFVTTTNVAGWEG